MIYEIYVSDEIAAIAKHFAVMKEVDVEAIFEEWVFLFGYITKQCNKEIK